MTTRIVSTGLFEMDGKGGLRKVEGGFNDLTPGRVIKWGGNQAWSPTGYVIVKSMGDPGRDGFSYGVRYKSVNLTSGEYGPQIEAHNIKSHDDPKLWHTQHFYLEEQVIPDEELKAIVAKAEDLKQKHEAEVEEKERIRLERVVEGRRIAAERIPATAKALIVAKREVSDCDSQTDYFATHTEEIVVLGWSSHTRDIFSEMRKVADRIPETAHLATPPTVDSNGHEKDERNAEWWTPGDEHREKYSMGAGYYLKAAGRYSNGWKIEKETRYRDGDFDDRYYASLAVRCVLPEPGKTSTQVERATTKVEGITVKLNEEKNGIEIYFPEKPNAAILDGLKANGWRWSRFNACWYHQQTAEALAFADSLAE